MPLSPASRGACCAARVRRRPGHAIAHSAALFALTLLVIGGCRTPWQIESLPIDQLEPGMNRDEVSRVLGEPRWSDTFVDPETPIVGYGSDPTATTQLYTAWGYEDERVDPEGLFFASVFFPIYVPVYLVSLAFPIDEAERDCVWTDQRWIDLFFEDDQLAEWVVTPQPERGWCDDSGGYYSAWSGYWGPYPWTYGRYHYYSAYYYHRDHHDHGDGHHDHGDRGDHHRPGDRGGPGDRNGPGRRTPGNSGDSSDREFSRDHDDRPRAGRQPSSNGQRVWGNRTTSGGQRGATGSRSVGNRGSSGKPNRPDR